MDRILAPGCIGHLAGHYADLCPFAQWHQCASWPRPRTAGLRSLRQPAGPALHHVLELSLHPSGQADAHSRTAPDSACVFRSIWTGIVAGCLGAYISVLLLLVLSGRLLFVFMRAPQGGMPVIKTATENRAEWVSAIDMMDLMTMGSTLTAEISVVVFSLCLCTACSAAPRAMINPMPPERLRLSAASTTVPLCAWRTAGRGISGKVSRAARTFHVCN